MITQLKHPIKRKDELLDMMFEKMQQGAFGDSLKSTMYIDADMVQEIMQPIFDKLKTNYIIKSAWMHYMMPGANHESGHNHSTDVGVYYLQVSPTSGDLLFNDLKIQITPEVGLFLIVPAKEIHSMLENKSDIVRIAMGMEIEK